MENKINLPTSELTYCEALEFFYNAIPALIKKCNNLEFLMFIYNFIEEEIESAPLN